MDVHVDPDQVDELARPHRPAGAVLHPRVEILDGDARFVEHADAVVQQRDQDAVDDEAGRVVAADRVLSQPLAEGVRRLERVVGGALGADDLDERHQRRRVEEVHADDALRFRARRRDLGHGQRRRVRREHDVVADEAVELGEQLLLRLELLDDRLDHEIAVGEIRHVRGERQPRDRRVAVALLESALLHLAREEVADPFAGALAELGGHLPADGLHSGLDAELRDPCAHRSEPDDADLANLSRHGRRSYRSALVQPRTARR